MLRPRYSLRLAAVGVVVLAVSVGLTGCTPAPTGRSATATEQQIESIPGVEKATIRADSSLDGFVSKQTINITVVVSDGYQVGDADGAIVWLAQEAWSAGPKRPGSMGISLEDSSGKPLDWGWKDALAKHGWDKDAGANDGWDVANVDDGVLASSRLIVLTRSAMTSLTGDSWPGPVPETPANLFVKN
jgi:hypothetical protein